jgi:hypothetical protein
MKKIYIGCSLAHAPEDYKEDVEKLKKQLNQKFKVIDFNEPENGTDEDIFAHNSSSAKTCDLMVADCSHPSIGLGFEIATALQNHKPVLGVAHGSAKVSRFVLGINNPLFSLVRYQSMDEVADAVEKKLAGII